jgi:hypothetical protein
MKQKRLKGLIPDRNKKQEKRVGSVVDRPEKHVYSEFRPLQIRGGQSGTWTGLSPIASVFPCQHDLTNAPY